MVVRMDWRMVVKRVSYLADEKAESSDCVMAAK